MKILNSAIFLSFIVFYTGCVGLNPFRAGADDVVNEYPPSSIGTDSQYYNQEPIRTKAMYRATMRPYTINNQTYYPKPVKIGQKFAGVASWYGPNFHGGQTSNGEYYDMYAMTAAHKTLPMNTEVEITNLENGQKVIVRINDRGPFVKDRIIDLSNQAAHEIGMIKNGTAKVKMRVVSVDETANQFVKTKPKEKIQKKYISQKEDIKNRDEREIIIQDDARSRIAQNQDNPNRFKIQLFSTSQKEKADKLKEDYSHLDYTYQTSIKTKSSIFSSTLYRVMIGDFYSFQEAKNFIQDHQLKDAFIVKD